MRAAKVVFFALGVLAMISSLSPVMAQYQEDPNPGGGTGGSYWVVKCEYNEFEQLIKKTCTSGGSHSCNCP